jgi:hypothetical protein
MEEISSLSMIRSHQGRVYVAIFRLPASRGVCQLTVPAAVDFPARVPLDLSGNTGTA